MTTQFHIICKWCRADERQHPFAALSDTPLGERLAEKVFGVAVDRRGKRLGGRGRRRYWNRCLTCGSIYSAPPPGYADRVAFKRLEKIGQLTLEGVQPCPRPNLAQLMRAYLS